MEGNVVHVVSKRTEATASAANVVGRGHALLQLHAADARRDVSVHGKRQGQQVRRQGHVPGPGQRRRRRGR